MTSNKKFPLLICAVALLWGACNSPPADVTSDGGDLAVTGGGDLSMTGAKDLAITRDGGDLDAGTACYPSCLTDVVSKCPVVTPCTQQAAGNNISICAPDGVVYSGMGSPQTMSLSVTVTKAGTECYHTKSTFGKTSTVSYFMSGSTTAFATITSSGQMDKVTCDGMTYMVDTSSASCPSITSVPKCTAGKCP